MVIREVKFLGDCKEKPIAIMDMETKNSNTGIIKTEVNVSLCTGCGLVILDRFILEVSGLPWHSKCLKCSACQASLESEPCCYLRDSQVYCRADYQRVFGTKCSKCNRIISAKDWVRRARDQVYHLACFACDGCKRQLSTGEEFALAEDKVLCKLHFQEIFDGSSNEDSCGDGESSSSSSKSKTKRVRTTFSDEQLAVLQANFQLDSNPDGQDLERIAQITGLSKRVTQVWFQNSRARQKKHMAKQKKGGYVHHHHPHHGTSSFEKTSSSSVVVSGQLSDSDSTSGASPLTMLYSFT